MIGAHYLCRRSSGRATCQRRYARECKRLPARWGHPGAALAPCAEGVVESYRWTAMQYGRCAQMVVMLSVFVGRGVRVGVRKRAGGGGDGWHGRRCGYDVRLLGAAGMVADKPARWRLAAWRVGGGCWGEERRGGGGRVVCLTRERSVVAARHSSRKVWRYVGRNGSAEVRAFVSTGRFTSSSSSSGVPAWACGH